MGLWEEKVCGNGFTSNGHRIENKLGYSSPFNLYYQHQWWRETIHHTHTAFISRSHCTCKMDCHLTFMDPLTCHHGDLVFPQGNNSSLLLRSRVRYRSSWVQLLTNNDFNSLLNAIAPIRPFIELKKVKFVGGLKFDENGTTYRSIEPGTTQYVGEPNEAIDRAWRRLIQGMFFHPHLSLRQNHWLAYLAGEEVDVIGEEAEGVAGTTYQKEGLWWVTGADVFHQLHCVVSCSAQRQNLDLRSLTVCRICCVELSIQIITHHLIPSHCTRNIFVSSWFFLSVQRADSADDMTRSLCRLLEASGNVQCRFNSAAFRVAWCEE